MDGLQSRGTAATPSPSLSPPGLPQPGGQSLSAAPASPSAAAEGLGGTEGAAVASQAPRATDSGDIRTDSRQ
eukprot:12925100-Alexandrium_andersonii.AAC.1